MSSENICKSRFCPSPTGLMHLGNLRTALFNVLLAKQYESQNHQGTFLLRIEDTDNTRSQQEFTTALLQDLRWLDLYWQEGPESSGESGPYFQSQRLEIYQQYYSQLLDQKQAYWCFCTDAELAVARKSQINAGLPPRYAGTCRHLRPEQIEAKRAKGLKPALRFLVPDNEVVKFEDFIQGSRLFAADDIGDFIIQKADNSSSFMFCNAVDDALMGVTHVMRGDDHLTNTPRQLMILKALGLRKPEYGHMPMIFGHDGKPLSKRNGSQSIEDLRSQGYFPAAIINYLSRLGHHFDNDKLLSLSELGQNFNLKHIGHSPARFDLAQLNHWQKEAVMAMSEATLWEWMEPAVRDLVSSDQAALFSQTIKQNILFPQEAKGWADCLLGENIVREEAAVDAIERCGPDNLKVIAQAIEAEGENYVGVQSMVSQSTNLKGKTLFMPLRAIFTGRLFGPELAKIFLLMGKTRLLQRVREAEQLFLKMELKN